MDILILFVVSFCFYVYGVYTGWKAREHHAIKMTRHLVKEVEKKVEEEQNSLIQITIEEHNGIFYVYDKKDNTFMAQGKNKQELEDVLNSRFPGKKFAATEEELQKAGLLS